METTLQPKGLRKAPNSTLGELIDAVASRRRSQHDFVTRADQLYADDKSGCLVARQAGYREFRLRNLATNQLAARLGVPGQYLQKCPSELVAENVNHWLAEQPDRQFLIRCNGDDIRAVLSSRYSPVDHDMLLQWVSEAVGRDAQVRSELTEEQMVLQLVNRREHGTATDRLHTGVNIRNSEVGLSCVEVSGLVYRTICLGREKGSGTRLRLRYGASQTPFRFVHSAATLRRFLRLVRVLRLLRLWRGCLRARGGR